jgi:SAM-dependent methyltransferase
VRTKILPNSMLALVKRNAVVYTALRTIRMQGGRVIPPRRVDGVPGRIHFNDFMFSGEADDGVQWYVGGARNVIDLLERSLTAAGRSLSDVGAVTDFGCGYGRVIRLLVEQVEPRKVYATDLIREGVAFCAGEFGVNPIFTSGKGVPTLPPTDLLYAISVQTHVPAPVGRDLLTAWGASIEPNGVLFFTTHNPDTAATPAQYGIDNSLAPQLSARLEQDGFAYAPYAHYLGDTYGVAWHTPEHVAELATDCLPGFCQVLHLARGLDGHQDVYAYTRAGDASGA